jgi:hypothetical protein
MPTVRVGYRGVAQVRPYEPLECVLAIEGETVAEVMKEATPANIQRMVQAFEALKAAGDAALARAVEEMRSPSLPAGGMGSGVRPNTPRPDFPRGR